MKAKIGLKLNVTYRVIDKNGNAKKLFNPNKLYQSLLKLNLLPKGLKSDLLGFWDDKLLISNLITTAGKAAVADILSDQGSTAAFDYIAVGTGTTAANVADTTLETEITDSGLARAQGTASQVTTDTTDDTAQVVKSFTVTGSKAVTESGLLNAASSGTLLAHQVFSAINVDNGDTFEVTWKIDID